MISLLDVSVLIALVDADHVGHQQAHAWFSEHRDDGWATCPITENGVVRIIGGSKYPNYPGSLAKAVDLVRALQQVPGHIFWADDLSIFDPQGIILTDNLEKPGQITDTYLLALAAARGARFVTLDRRLTSDTVTGGASALHILTV